MPVLKRPFLIAWVILLLVATGCISSHDSGDTKPSNLALVFPINPVATPSMEKLVLPAANDAKGVLVSPADADGLRRLAVYSCADEGATNTINIGHGPTVQRICSLVQRANKNDNGSFVYTDYEDAVAGIFDPDDIHAEVSAFYHASKFYEFFTRPEVGLFDSIPLRH
ncbi:MAG: hypothetical protein GXP49_01765, partial [Deltaproteobacteria bacterium]|nr:hypothetical protein [Deltaproteobacteria bacterium]